MALTPAHRKSSWHEPNDNILAIEVVNRWANRLIGDQQPADANVRTVTCPPGFLGGQTLKAVRYTFTTHNPYQPQSPLVASGLPGPVSLLTDFPSNKKITTRLVRASE